MMLSEGTVFGEKYYTVDPDIKAYEPFWYHQDWHDMENWCKKTFGDTPKDGVWTPSSRWYMNNRKFWFKEEADRIMFILRWS
jgi:hypothetical protein